jgi:hypothetical protein
LLPSPKDYQTAEGMAVEPYEKKMDKIEDWLNKEVVKGRRARLNMRTCRSGDYLFLLEKAQKAEATAKILRKVIKL